MSESKRRGWIKNIIIIFLVIMLVLTLFSNTIMNRSLPEVSVSNGSSGTITSQVKLSGSVSANQIKQITFDNARTVDTVMVRRGDYVDRGTVLATLIAGESSEIYDLEIALRRLEIEYKQLLIAEPDSLTQQQRTLADSEKALAELESYIAEYPALEATVKGYEDQIAVLENTLDAIDEYIEEIDDVIAGIEKSMEELPVPPYNTNKALTEALEEAKDALDDAESATTAAKRAMNTAKSVKTNAETEYNERNEEYEAKKAIADGYTNDIAEKNDTLEAKKDERDSLQAKVDAGTATEEETAQLATLKSEISTLEDDIDDLEKKQKKAENEASELWAGVYEASTKLGTATSDYTAAASTYNAAKSAENAAENLVDDLNDGFSYLLLKSRIDENEDIKAEKQEEKEEIAEQIEDVNELLSKAKEEITKTPDECEDEKLELERAIEDAKNAIAIANSNGAIEDETLALNIDIKKKEIEQKKKEIAKLKGSAVSTELTAPVSGTISTIGIASGDDVEADTVAFEITMNDMGYTMECSVTNAQAARLRVGQEAEVQYYYWGDKPSVRISQIKSDPNSGGKSKLVTFTVEGDVSDGTSLSLVIGSDGQSYDTVVPNSAIREDANGNFVLKVVSKSSPLGNRYYAERVDVNVLASDATKSAIDASFAWGDYVITGASVPISDGMQVRMSE